MLHRLLTAIPALVLTALAGASAPVLAQYQDDYYEDRYQDRYDDRYADQRYDDRRDDRYDNRYGDDRYGDDRYYDEYDRDPPERVGRLAHVSGEASFSPGGGDEWYRAVTNRPIVRGDRLYTGDRGLVEVQLGGAALRMDEHTAVDVLTLDEDYVQVELAEGTINLSIEDLWDGVAYEIATPMAAILVTEPGSVRVDVDPRTGITDVVVWDGRAEAYGTRVTFPLRDGDAVRFYDPELYEYEMYRVPRPDRFDRWVATRDDMLRRSVSRRYLPQGVIGYSDLDRYGAWDSVADYGHVWFPRDVRRDWAPYRDGHWIWQDPWGWTWVDDSPWGFAPFHYGRWVHVGSRWGWLPGPRQVRAVYAPALVAFVGGSNWSVGISLGSRPVGWFPLGPREVYVPPYYASRDYFRRINVSNTVINNTVITNVYNNYYVNNSTVIRDVDYRYRGIATTAVAADAFVRGAAVNKARIKLDPAATTRAEIRRFAAASPQATSLAGSVTQRAKARPDARTLQRPVIARRAPAPEPVSFEARAREIERNDGRPLAREQVQRLRQESKTARPQARQVRVVGEPEQQVSRDKARQGRSAERELPRGEVTSRARTPAAAAPERGDAGPRSERQRADLEPRTARPERVRSEQLRQQQDEQPQRGRSPRAASKDDSAEPRTAPERARDDAAARGRADREQQQREQEQRATQERARDDARGRAVREQQERAVEQRAAGERAQQEARGRAARDQQKRADEQRAAQARAQEEARGRAAREQQQRADEQRAAQARAQEEARGRAAREQQERATEQRAAQARAQEEARGRAAREQQERASEQRAAQARAQEEARGRAAREQQKRANEQRAAQARAQEEARGRAAREQQERANEQRAVQARAQEEARARTQREQQQRAAEQQQPAQQQVPARGRAQSRDEAEDDDEDDEKKPRGRARGRDDR